MKNSIDPRTGFSLGYHGDPMDAIDFILDSGMVAYDDEGVFLELWRQGSLDEYPEFYEWLSSRRNADGSPK